LWYLPAILISSNFGSNARPARIRGESDAVHFLAAEFVRRTIKIVAKAGDDLLDTASVRGAAARIAGMARRVRPFINRVAP
jgi:hypothetical protein